MSAILTLAGSLPARSKSTLCDRLQQTQDMFTRFWFKTIRQNGIGGCSILREFQFGIIENNVSIIADAKLTSHLHGNSYFWSTLCHRFLLKGQNGRLNRLVKRMF